MKLAILASGSGSNAQAILNAVAGGQLKAEVCVVLTNRPGAGVLERAACAGVPSVCVDHTKFTTREAFDTAVVEKLSACGVDTVALAGFMRMVTPVLLDAFAGRVLNIHPALLPAFAGVHGAKDANDYGVKLAGCTVHFVDALMDNGPVIIQAVVPVHDDDTANTLQQRILSFEHRIYPQALQWLSEGRLIVQDRKVRLAPCKKPSTRGATPERFSLFAEGAMVVPALD